MTYLREASMRARINELEAELEVRTRVVVTDWRIPVDFRRHGYSSAYQSGYENGWRNRTQSRAPYAREHLRRAWRQGYDNGHAASEAEIKNLIDARKAKR